MFQKDFELSIVGVARTRTPSTTNYDVDSATWADLRRVHLQSAMEVTSLGHGSARSPIDPVQVSMFNVTPPSLFIPSSSLATQTPFRCGITPRNNTVPLLQSIK